MLVTSSMVLTVPAPPTPAVATLAGGRTADLVSYTTSASTTPMTIGIH